MRNQKEKLSFRIANERVIVAVLLKGRLTLPECLHTMAWAFSAISTDRYAISYECQSFFIH
jgi:hypothetical protein